MVAPAPALIVKARWLLNAALLALVAGLALFAWLRPPDRSDPRPPLTAMAAPTIARVAIERKDREPIVLERGEDRWRMRSPVKARANGFAVESLLQLASAPVELTLPAAEPGRYGLDRPDLVVRLDQEEIAFGTMHPLKDQYYVRHGNAIHLVPGRYYAQAASPYSAYIDARIIEEGRQPAAFKLPGFSLAIKDGGWRRSPDEKALSSDRINAFVEEWRHARALSVERATARPARERIEITFREDAAKAETLTLGVVTRAPELVLRREDEGLEYHFPEETAKRLLELTATADERG